MRALLAAAAAGNVPSLQVTPCSCIRPALKFSSLAFDTATRFNFELMEFPKEEGRVEGERESDSESETEIDDGDGDV